MTAEHSGCPPPIEQRIANLALPNKVIFLGNAATHAAYLEDIGADGLEYTPLKRGKLPNQINRHLDREENRRPPVHEYGREWVDRIITDEPILSYEEQKIIINIFRGGHSSFVQSNADDPFSFLLQDIPTSIRTLDRMQRQFRDMDAVLYGDYLDGNANYVPYYPVKEYQVHAPFPRRSLQPKAHEFMAWDISENSPIEDIVLAMRVHGFTHIRWDDLHAQVGFKNPHALLDKLLRANLLDGAHNSINRIDIARPWTSLGKATMQARRAFIKSQEAAAKTHEGESLIMIATYHKTTADSNVKSITLEDGPVRSAATKKHQRAIIEHTRILVG